MLGVKADKSVTDCTPRAFMSSPESAVTEIGVLRMSSPLLRAVTTMSPGKLVAALGVESCALAEMALPAFMMSDAQDNRRALRSPEMLVMFLPRIDPRPLLA
jgi:hypothetical protein